MALKSKFATPVFNILISEAKGSNIFDLNKSRDLYSIHSEANPFATNPIIINADPFLFIQKGILYLLYEEQRGLIGKEIIRMVSTEDLINWTAPTTILEETFHLSYPNIFKDDGILYMIPESGHNDDVRLYEVSKDLKSTKYLTTIISGENFVDSSIVKVNDTY